jgi:hypothetical protein
MVTTHMTDCTGCPRCSTEMRSLLIAPTNTALRILGARSQTNQAVNLILANAAAVRDALGLNAPPAPPDMAKAIRDARVGIVPTAPSTESTGPIAAPPDLGQAIRDARKEKR